MEQSELRSNTLSHRPKGWGRKSCRLMGPLLMMGLLACSEKAPVATDGNADDAPSKTALRPRVPLSKQAPVTRFTPKDPDHLVVKFNEGTKVKLAPFGLHSLYQKGDRLPSSAGVTSGEALSSELGAVQEVLANAGVSFTRAFEQSDDVLSSMKRNGESRTRRQLADLSLYYSIPSTAFRSVRSMEAVRDALNGLSSVEGAYIRPKNVVPDAATPDFTGNQGYTDPAPLGVDADYAATFPGGRGDGIHVIDIEYRWTVDHEDLPPLFFSAFNPSSTGERDHGTAALGIVCAMDNGYGITGIAADAECGIASQIGIGIPGAIVTATTALSSGDVILLEAQTGGPVVNPIISGQNNLIPVEFYQAEFDAIATATANGITVVEAAGNGNVLLDHPYYLSRFDRSVRDSGAIIVGGSDPTTRTYGGGSNAGTRVDVHSWYGGIMTLGYGTATPNHSMGELDEYTDGFGGTSGASAIIAGVATAMQGVAADIVGAPLAPKALRALLTATGTPQAGVLDNPIGPQPDMRQAIDTLIAEAPIPDFTYSCDGPACAFSDESVAMMGPIVSWNWSFGDGATATTANPLHTYGTGGVFPVALTVSDGMNSRTITRRVKISGDRCVVEPIAPTSVLASSVQSTNTAASNAIDDDESTEWMSAAGMPQWLMVDLGSVRHIGAAALSWSVYHGVDFDLQVSDTGAGDWMTVYTNANSWGHNETAVELKAMGRYVRVYVRSGDSTASGCGLRALTIYGYPDPLCPAPAIECATDEECNDDEECTTNSCRPDGICLLSDKSNGSACSDDGAACTVDTCDFGKCRHPLKDTCRCYEDTDCDDKNECTNDTCQSDGACEPSAVPDNTPCGTDDNDATADVCMDGQCMHLFDNSFVCTEDTDCDDQNACTIDTCENNTCSFSEAPVGSPCVSDSNDCTEQYCQRGVCKTLGMYKLACDDGDACTPTDECYAGYCVGIEPENGGCGCTLNDECPDGEVCEDGECRIPCDDGLTECAGSCVDTDTDESNCGECGVTCNAGYTCEAGSCVPESACDENATSCDGECVDLLWNNQNCGECGNVCPAGGWCEEGDCRCPNDFLICDGGCVNQHWDQSNCGACGNVCSSWCNNGTCA